MRAVVIAGALGALVLSLAATPARGGIAGEGVDKSISASRTDVAPVIDGILSDLAWKRARVDERFTQSFPLDGARPSQRTQLRILYDNRSLYIGIDALDTEPDKILARTARRDNRVDSDWVQIVIDPRHDHDTGYQFWINAAGAVADGQMHDDTRLNADWNGIWYGKAHIHRRGWSAELAIPYASLRFGEREDPRWGINVTRYVFRTKEVMRWAHIGRNDQGDLSRAGHITGLSGIKPPRALELRPFLVARVRSLFPRGGTLGIGDDGASDRDFAGGVDLKYGITPNLTLDTTVLPDFGQVEADPVFLNLSTYEVQLPERRPFFLENADLFQTDVRMFYSRRIGERPSGYAANSEVTTAQGEPAIVTDAPLAVPIYAAARVTGKLSRRFTVAALDAVTGPERLDARTLAGDNTVIEPTPLRNYAALRGKYSLGGSSYLGFMTTGLTRNGTLENPARDHDAYAESIDGRWVARDGMYRLYFHVAATHRVGGPRFAERASPTGAPCTITTCTQLARADGTLQAPGDFGHGAELGGGKVGGTWTIWGNYSYRSPLFDVNDVGFETEWDYHRGYLTLGWRRPKPFSIFQHAAVNLNGFARYGFDGLRKEQYVELTGSVLYKNFWSHSVSLSVRPPHTYTTRETSDGARYENAGLVSAYTWLGSDSRKQLTAGFGAAVTRATNDPALELWVGGDLSYRTAKQLTFSLNTGYQLSHDALRFYACADPGGGACSVRSARRDYLFTRLDSSSLSLTTRATWAMSTMMLLEAYAQLFAARGLYHDAHELLGVPGARPYLRRVEIFPNPTADSMIADSNFSFDNLNVNLLWRWEWKPGNTLIAVYTRAAGADRSEPVLTFRGLGTAPTTEVALLKMSLLFQ